MVWALGFTVWRSGFVKGLKFRACCRVTVWVLVFWLYCALTPLSPKAISARLPQVSEK